MGEASDSVDLAVGAGGVVWLNVGAERRGVLATLDGSTWSYPTWPDGADGVGASEANPPPDGASWVMQESFDPRPHVARRQDGLNVNRLGVSPDGSVLATALSGCPGPLADSPTPTCPNPDLDGAGHCVITPEVVAAIE